MTNFWEGLLMADTSIKSPELEYLLYYDIDGKPVTYACEAQKDLQYNSIAITKEQYEESRFDIVVKNGKILSINNFQTFSKIAPAETGTKCHADNALIIDSQGSKYWALKSYNSM
jgi:hypothetical protein